MTEDKLCIDYCGASFPNPLILPSGIAQEIPRDHDRMIKLVTWFYENPKKIFHIPD